MKILQMGPYPPPHGGVQTNLIALRQYLLKRGIACPVINLTRFRREERDGVYYPNTALGVMRLLLRLEYDVIHLHAGGDFSPRHVAVLLLCSLLPGKKVVFTFHSGGYPGSEAGQRAKAGTLRGFVLRRLDGLIAVNQELANLYRSFGVEPQRIRLIPPHAVEAPAESSCLPGKMEEFFSTHSPLLVTVSGLEPEYDLPLQLEAVGELRAKFPGIGLAIIGGGSLEAELNKRINAKPYAEQVLLCGDIPHVSTLQALVRCDLFLRTTWYDGDSISVREALHTGVPVIATDNRMRPPGVQLIPIGDGRALVRAASWLLAEGSKGPRRTNTSPPAGLENLQAVLRFYEDLAGKSRA